MAKSSKTSMTKTAAARIQSAEAKANGGKTAKVDLQPERKVQRIVILPVRVINGK